MFTSHNRKKRAGKEILSHTIEKTCRRKAKTRAFLQSHEGGSFGSAISAGFRCLQALASGDERNA